MNFFRDDSLYISIVELESGCYQFKINFQELEKRISYSPFMSREMSSGRVRWFLRYSNACFASAYNPMAFASLDIYFKTINDRKKSFELSLLDKAGKPVMTVSQGASAYSIPLIIMKVFLEEVAVVDGCFFVQCKISSLKTSFQKVSLPEQLGNLWKSGELSDVTIEVNGELFQAHKMILGARSAVFKAQLFGSMVEAQLGCIRIEDMETEVFKCVLHYIYTDTLDGDPETISTNMAQHLLVASDRYGIEGLRKKCEGRLCKSVSLDSVLSCFVLAEQHNCSKLKNACLKFATEPTNLAKLVFTEEYFHFMQNFPGLVALLRNHAEQL